MIFGLFNFFDERLFIQSLTDLGLSYFIEWGIGSSGWLYKYRTEGIRSIIKGIEYNLEYNIADLKIIYDCELICPP